MPSPALTEHDESSPNPREEPTLEVEEHKIAFTNNYKPTNGEHVQSDNDLPPVEVFDKSSAILNGFVGQAKLGTGNHLEKETLEMNETAHQPINR